MKEKLLYHGREISNIRLFFVLLCLALVNIEMSVAQTPGTANIYPPTGGFAIDGNLDATPTGGDWLQGSASEGGYVLNQDASPVNPYMTFSLDDAYAPALDNVFKGGKIYDNPNNFIWEMQNANGKSDMNRAFLHLTVDVATGDKWAIFSADRKVSSGVSYLDFEFLQNSVIMNDNGTFTSNGPHGGRTVGDFVVTANFGNGTTVFQVWTWQESTTVPGTYHYVQYTGDLSSIAYAAENLSSIPSTYPVFGGYNYAANTYVEGAINLSTFIGTVIPCTNTAINTLFIKTKASQSIEATLQDFIEPIQLQSLMIGSANAGNDQTLCDEGEFTTFTVTGEANPVMGYTLQSTNWSVVSYTGTQSPVIANPGEATTEIYVYDGSAVISFTATSSNGDDICSVSDELTLTVNPKPAPTWTNPPADYSVTCNDAGNIVPTLLNYTNGITGQCALSGSVMGVISGNYDECGGILYQTWTFTDPAGQTITYIQTITVAPSPQASFINIPSNTTISCDQATTFAATNLSYSNESLNGCLIAGEVMGVITGTYTECGGTLYETWTFVDDCGREIEHVQTITVSPAPQAAFINPPADITITCDEATTFAATNLGYTNAGIGGCLIAGEVMGVITGTYTECGGTLYETWTFVDDCGRQIQHVQTITVSPAPEAAFIDPPADITISCVEALTFASSSLSYSNSGLGGCIIEGTVQGVITGSFTECGGSLTQTWTFTDDCGRTITYNQIITVEPAPQAQFAEVEDIQVSCDQVSTIQPSYLAYSNGSTGACTISGEVLGVITGSYNNCNGILTQTWTFVDNCGRTSTQTQTISIYDNTAPTFTAPENITIYTDQNCEYNADVTVTGDVTNEADNCSTGLEATYTDEIADGICTGSHIITRTWTLTDDCGNSAPAQIQIITVLDNLAPVITTEPGSLDVTLECSDEAGLAVALAMAPTATDNCTSEPVISLISDVTTNSTECDNEYTRVRIWTFTDDCNNTSTQFTQTITVSDNTAPVWTNVPVNMTVECDGAGNVAQLNAWLTGYTGTDNCGEVFLSNNFTGLSDLCGQTGSALVTFTLTDECGNSITAEATFTIVDTQAPVINAPANITLSNDPGVCGAQVTIAPVNGNDNCGTVVVTNNINGTNNASGFYNVGTTTILWTATDECGNTSTGQTIVTVNDEEAPQIFCPPHMTVNVTPGVCEAYVTVPAPTVSDNCEIRQVTNTYTHTDDASGVYPVGTTVVWWTAVDMSGNTDNCFMNITVVDNENPTIICPEDITVNTDQGVCEASVIVPVPVVNDNCGIASLVNSFNQTGDASGIYPVGTTTVTWTATDNSGNEVSCSMTVTVIDNEIPEIICPENISISADLLACGADVIVPLPTVNDNCGVDNYINSFTGSDNASAFYPVGNTAVTWTVTDIHGNTSTCVMNVTVIDDAAPEIICPSNVVMESVSGQCGADVSIPQPEVKDNCGIESIINNYNGTANASDFYPTGTTVISWTVTDIHGNTSVCDMVVTIEDKEAPTIICPENIEIVAGENCEAVVSMPEPEVFDNCGIAGITNDFNSTSNASGTYPAGTTIVKWTVSDVSGNTVECSTIVHVLGNILAADDYGTTAVNTPVTMPVLLNDTDCDNNIDAASMINLSDPMNGSVQKGNEPGTFIYTPAPGFYGIDEFNYRICDADGLCDEATVYITITAPTEKLLAVDDEYTSEVNTEVEITNLANDTYSPFIPVITILEQPKHGTIEIHGDYTATYTPNLDWNGTDTYTYILSDVNAEAIADTALTTITIVPAEVRDTVIIYNVITPDNDGYNDTWYIEGIEEYSDNEVLLFNRWGDQIRYFENYNNSTIVWNGTNKNGELLPSGTYYYIVKLRSIQKIYTGWVVIHGSK